jgi:hypothetical protein
MGGYFAATRGKNGLEHEVVFGLSYFNTCEYSETMYWINYLRPTFSVLHDILITVVLTLPFRFHLLSSQQLVPQSQRPVQTPR